MLTFLWLTVINILYPRIHAYMYAHINIIYIYATQMTLNEQIDAVHKEIYEYIYIHVYYTSSVQFTGHVN